MSSLESTSVAIIPASAMRDSRTLLRRTNPDDIPINAAYYLTPQRHPPPPSTSSAPSYPAGYEQHQGYRNYAGPESTPGSYRRVGAAMVQGPIHGPSFPYSVSVLGTPRSQRKSYRGTVSVAGSAPERSTLYRTRSYSTVFAKPDNRVPIGNLKSISGPYKNPEPMYKKYRYRRTASGGLTPAIGAGDGVEMLNLAPGSRRSIATIDTLGHSGDLGYAMDTNRGLRRHYAPTYTSGYPPSSVYRSERRRGLNYGLVPRIILKLAQLISGAIVIACVCGVTGGRILGNYTAATRSQGQIFVVVIAAIALVFTFVLLLTVGLANRFGLWRNFDAGWNATATFMYLIAASVEAWYANCYPPVGVTYRVACHLPAWVAAAVFAFFNVLFYAADTTLAVLAGSTVL